MASFVDNTIFTAISGGTGDFIVAGATPGYQSPVGRVVDTKQYRYRAQTANMLQWEIGVATSTLGGTTFTRSVVTSSIGGGLIDFVTPPNVMLTFSANDFLQFDDDMALTPIQRLQGRKNIGLDQVDNTADANKPISSATQTALDLKANAQTPEAFGAVGDGISNDLAAVISAATAGNGYIKGSPGSIYRLELGTSSFTTPSTFVFDLNGATLKPIYTGTRYPWEVSLVTAATYALSSQVNGAGFVTTVDNPPAGLAAGDTVMFESTGLGGNNPPSWRTVGSVSGTTTGLDRTIPFAYSGTVTMRKVTFAEKFIIENGTIDYSGIDDNALGGFNLSGYKLIRFNNLDLTNINFDRADGTDYVITAGYALSGEFRDIRCRNVTKNGTFVDAGQFGDVSVEGIVGQGDGFGINIYNSDFYSVERNDIHARYQEGTTYSVRGIKIIGCRAGTVRANRITNYDSGIKVQNTAGSIIDGNTIEWCGIGINNSSQSPLSTSYENNTIRNNRIRYSTNTAGAIVVSDDTSNKTIVSGNLITEAYGPGIRADGLVLHIVDNLIYNWGRSTTTAAAIMIGDADATGLMDGNQAITDDTNNIGWYIQSGNTGFRAGENFTNATTIWDATNQAGRLAAAGNIGEYIESDVLIGSAVALTNLAVANITSISLTPGDWDVWGVIATVQAGGPTTTALVGTINTTSATLPTDLANKGATTFWRGSTTSTLILPVGTRRYSLTSTTTVYLIINPFFTGGTSLSGYGTICARRVRQ